MSWTAQQHAMLAAMGLSPMHRRAAGESLRVPDAVAAVEAGVRAPARGAPTAAPASRAASTPAAPPAARPGALLEALRRAAGGRDIADLVADLERLRREPALKRALWPRLRALRRH